MNPGLVLIGLVALERWAELVRSQRNARALLARGGVEVGRGHYPAMVALHGALLVCSAAEGSFAPLRNPAVTLPALAVALLAQGLRWWAIAALGERWCTRVIVLPGAPLAHHGPYRFLRHPNYLAVVLEAAALPLAAGAWRAALVFSFANAMLLAVRIRVEERALGLSSRPTVGHALGGP